MGIKKLYALYKYVKMGYFVLLILTISFSFPFEGSDGNVSE